MDMKTYAKSYLRGVGAVIPVGTYTFIGKDGKEVSMWKRPLIKDWTTDPLRSEEQIDELWDKQARWGHIPGIAIPTGQITGGIIAIDLDVRLERDIDGIESWRDWERETGLKLPEETWTAISGSGGYHLYYRTDKELQSYSNGSVGIDLRAEGAMIIVPPSPHISGRYYTWEYSPREFPLAEADEAVLKFIEDFRPKSFSRTEESQNPNSGSRYLPLPEQIPEGQRHNVMISLIGALTRYGLDDDTIEYVVRQVNAKKCLPPLTETELQKQIISAIGCWEKGYRKENNLWKKKRKQKLKEETLDTDAWKQNALKLFLQ